MFIALQLQSPVTSPGVGSFTSHSFEILLICAVSFLLGWFLHHLIYCSRHLATIRQLEGNLKSARTRIGDLEGDLESCNGAIINIKGENAALSTKLARLRKAVAAGDADIEVEVGAETDVVEHDQILDEAIVSGLASDIAGSGTSGFDAELAKAVFGRVIREDDMQVIEGIGPKTATLLNNSSIHTWRQLGNTAVPQLQNILNTAGDRFQLLNPGTWPKQARMAADGEWIKLREYQDYLVGGVEPSEIPPPVSPAGSEALYVMGRKIEPNDLTVIEGIGPKIQGLLKESGIDTWSTLAEATVAKLQSILEDAGDRYRMHNPSTWPKQAEMAAAGEWDKLREYQDFLDGGRKPS